MAKAGTKPAPYGCEKPKEYIGEIADEEHWEKLHTKVVVMATSVEDALKKIFAEAKKQGKDVYQVLTKFPGKELEQPVWDFFNNILMDDM